jgi:hypothetical protein
MELLRKGLGSVVGAGTWQCRPIQRTLAVQSITSTEEKALATLLILGRPNVGKSTFFNRLIGRRSALVHDTPSSHVTRDYKEGVARFSDLKFRVIDTSGLEPAMSAESVQGRATRITQQVQQNLCTFYPCHFTFVHLALHKRAFTYSMNSYLDMRLNSQPPAPACLCLRCCISRSLFPAHNTSPHRLCGLQAPE